MSFVNVTASLIEELREVCADSVDVESANAVKPATAIQTSREFHVWVMSDLLVLGTTPNGEYTSSSDRSRRQRFAPYRGTPSRKARPHDAQRPAGKVLGVVKRRTAGADRRELCCRV